MAEIVLGIGTSHAPQLVTTVDEWALRVPADRANPVHHFRAQRYTFDELVALREPENIDAQLTPSAQQAHADRNAAALDTLAQRFRDARIDIAVIVGNDQNECFSTENVAPFMIHRGESFQAIPKTPEQIAKMPPGIAPTATGYCPPGGTTYAGVPELGTHIVTSLMAQGFDPDQTTQLPVGPQGTNGIQHAFGFVFRRIMGDDVPPAVPVFVNTHYPPNRPSPARCVQFGAALANAITSWRSDKRVALIASGGLTHYVIDETLDRSVLAAMEAGDLAALTGVDERLLQAGTAELQNWLPVASAMVTLKKRMTLVDYVPCYRSQAGTGTAMAFVTWN